MLAGIRLVYGVIKEYFFQNIEKKYGFSVYLKWRNIYGRITNPFFKERYREAYVLSLKKDEEKYLILRVSYPKLGLFSGVRYLMRIASWSEKNGYTIIVDWGFEADFLKGELGQYDFWGKIFKQPISLKEALFKPHVVVGYLNSVHRYDEDFMFQVNGDRKNNKIRVVAGEQGKNYYRQWKPFVDKYLIIQPEIITEFNEEVGDFFQNHNRILGVMLREGFTEEYKAHIPSKASKKLLSSHPTNPSLRESIAIVKMYFEKWNCDCIFLSTCWESTVEFFQKEFGCKVYCIKRERIAKGKWIFETSSQVNLEIAAMSAEEQKREILGKVSMDDIIEREKSYIKEVYGLAQCSYFIGAVCSGTIGALLLNGGLYEDSFIFENRNKNIDCSSY